jgi:hypothetical protein
MSREFSTLGISLSSYEKLKFGSKTKDKFTCGINVNKIQWEVR